VCTTRKKKVKPGTCACTCGFWRESGRVGQQRHVKRSMSCLASKRFGIFGPGGFFWPVHISSTYVSFQLSVCIMNTTDELATWMSTCK